MFPEGLSSIQMVPAGLSSIQLVPAVVVTKGSLKVPRQVSLNHKSVPLWTESLHRLASPRDRLEIADSELGLPWTYFQEIADEHCNSLPEMKIYRYRSNV